MPVGLLFRAFGVHEWTLLIFPAVMSAAMLALAYAFGRTFFSHEAGLITLAIFAVMPIDCRFATWLLSDVPSAVWAGGGILAMVVGRRTAKSSAKALAGLIAALCFGLSWLTRTQVAQLAPFVLGALVIWSWRDRKNLWLAGCAAAGVLRDLPAPKGLLVSLGDGRFPLSAPRRRETLRDAHASGISPRAAFTAGRRAIMRSGSRGGCCGKVRRGCC